MYRPPDLMGLPLLPDPPFFRMDNGVMTPFNGFPGANEYDTGAWLVPPPTMVPPPTVTPSFPPCPRDGYLYDQEMPGDLKRKRPIFEYQKWDSPSSENLQGVSSFDSNSLSPGISNGFHSLDFPSVVADRLYPPPVPRFAVNRPRQSSFGFFNSCRYSRFTGPATDRRVVLPVQPRVHMDFRKMIDHGFFNCYDSWRCRVTRPLRGSGQSYPLRTSNQVQNHGRGGRPYASKNSDSAHTEAHTLLDSDRKEATKSKPQLNKLCVNDEGPGESKPYLPKTMETVDSVYVSASTLADRDREEITNEEPQFKRLPVKEEVQDENIDVVN